MGNSKEILELLARTPAGVEPRRLFAHLRFLLLSILWSSMSKDQNSARRTISLCKINFVNSHGEASSLLGMANERCCLCNTVDGYIILLFNAAMYYVLPYCWIKYV